MTMVAAAVPVTGAVEEVRRLTRRVSPRGRPWETWDADPLGAGLTSTGEAGGGTRDQHAAAPLVTRRRPWIDDRRERAAGVGNDPNMQHLGRDPVDGPAWTRAARADEGDYGTRRAVKAEVGVRMPSGERTADAGARHSRTGHDVHRGQKPAFARGAAVDERFGAGGVEDGAIAPVAVVEVVDDRQRGLRNGSVPVAESRFQTSVSRRFSLRQRQEVRRGGALRGGRRTVAPP